MQYDYFIQSLNSNGRIANKFIMIPAALQASDMTPYLTQLQTSVSLPLDETTPASFRLRYFRHEEEIYPVLVIISPKHGIWRIGFNAGDVGIAEARKTLAGIRVVFERFQAQKQLKLEAQRQQTQRVSVAGGARQAAVSVSNGSPIGTEAPAAKRESAKVVHLASRKPVQERIAPAQMQLPPAQVAPAASQAEQAAASTSSMSVAGKPGKKKKKFSVLVIGVIFGMILSSAFLAGQALADEAPELVSVIPMPEIVAVPHIPEGEPCEIEKL